GDAFDGIIRFGVNALTVVVQGINWLVQNTQTLTAIIGTAGVSVGVLGAALVALGFAANVSAKAIKLYRVGLATIPKISVLASASLIKLKAVMLATGAAA